MKLYKEWCASPEKRKGVMLPLERIARFERTADAGYAGVYMFDEGAASQITASRSSAGLARFPVYTDELVIDLDKGLPQLERCRRALGDLGYRIYESGGKGYHVVVPLAEMMHGTNIPHSQRRWVEALNVEADLTLYQAGHIVSLPGRKHPRTGKRKALYARVAGEVLALPIVEAPKPTFAMGGSSQSELEQGLWRTLSLLQSEPGTGNRHVALWGTARHFADAGLEYATALNLLQEVNLKWLEQKDPAEVETAVKQAYAQSHRTT